METFVTAAYYLMTAAVAAVIVSNFLKSRDPQRMVLYAVVFTPFILRLLRIK
ncbi:MAG: hypothetical protein NUW23_01555 [Firmicutes bacterium]|jgi:hypothetical protein|nr:hypothetical protein [Bacillota bacterium]